MMPRMNLRAAPATDSDHDFRRTLNARMAAFAQDHIASRGDLRDHDVIPPELWRAFGDAGLAGFGVPEADGGCGGDYRLLAMAAETLASVGGVKGVVTCWLSRQIITRLHLIRLGTDQQRAAYAPKLAAGDLTPCMAISEPGAGAHPKHLKTSAVRDGDDFILNGEKAYLTNGPIADLFFVLAITGVKDGRNQFSVLIVLRDAPGMSLSEGVVVDFLKPAPHCGLRMENVRVPAANILGPEGDAFAAISLPMRRVEDALMAASVAGSMRHQLTQFAREVDADSLNEDDMTELGWLAAAPDGLSALAYRAAERVDLDPDDADVSNLAAAARDWARTLQERFGALMDKSGMDKFDLTPSPGLTAERRDLEKTLGIARTAHIIQAQRRAAALFADNAK
jgi:alkylation response protein AidB-like acyl-CoA dehydrogenase